MLTNVLTKCTSSHCRALTSSMRHASSTAAASLDFLLPLQPHTIRGTPPIVYHPGVFARIYQLLVEDGMLGPHGRGVHIPPHLPPPEVMHLAHCPAYLEAFCSGTLDAARVREIGFGETTQQPILVQRTLAEVAGGTHHAHYDRGSGFCILNDLATTAKLLIDTNKVDRVLIVDLDVHQGDGTAAILHDQPSVYTLSVHAGSNFPHRKQRSTLDIPLPDGVGDDEYLGTVSRVLPDVLSSFRPDVVLYDAGVDTHVDDALGHLAMTDAGLLRRELLVLDTCLGFGVPVAGYVGGGYHADLTTLARRHCALHEAARQLWRDHRL